MARRRESTTRSMCVSFAVQLDVPFSALQVLAPSWPSSWVPPARTCRRLHLHRRSSPLPHRPSANQGSPPRTLVPRHRTEMTPGCSTRRAKRPMPRATVPTRGGRRVGNGTGQREEEGCSPRRATLGVNVSRRVRREEVDVGGGRAGEAGHTRARRGGKRVLGEHYGEVGRTRSVVRYVDLVDPDSAGTVLDLRVPGREWSGVKVEMGR